MLGVDLCAWRPCDGTVNFNVGADLAVNPAQAGGSYSGTYSVTVIY
jgi:uncharacterized protein DUF4402